MSIWGWYRLFRAYGNAPLTSLAKAASVKRGVLAETNLGSCRYWREVK